MKRSCGRRFTGEEIGQLCALIADNPGRTPRPAVPIGMSTAPVAQSGRGPQGDELPGGHAAHAS